MSSYDRVIHKQAGVNDGKVAPWGRYDVGDMEMCVPHYFAITPFRRGLNKATGAEPVGLNAVLAHNGIRRSE